jgi:branched-chain amino acid transport system permease protein
MSVTTDERSASAGAPGWVRDRTAVRQLVVLAGFVVVVGLLPLGLSDRGESIAVRTLIIALLSVGWNLMSGYGGLFSFGHAAFFGIGAYTDAYLVVEHDISPWIAMALGALLAAVAGTLIAYLCLRYRLAGAYFALATFAFAQLFLLVVQNVEALGKTEGFNLPILPEESFWMMQFESGSSMYFWIPLGLLAASLAVVIGFINSRAGQRVQAVRDDETAAESLGISVMKYRLIPVALSCCIAAVAGAYYTQYYFFVGPEQAFGATVSVEAIVPAVIGGIGTVWGPVIGALVVGPLAELIAELLRNPPASLSFLEGLTGLDIVVYSVLLVAIVIFMPKGIYGTLRDRRRR